MNALTAIGQTKHSINVSIDPRVELMSVIQTISSYGALFPFLMNAATFPYGRDVADWFSGYCDHPVVKMLDELSSQPRMLNFMAPPTTMLYLTPELSLRDDVVWPESIYQRVGGRESLVAFLGHLSDFVGVSAFARFYAEHAAYYDQLTMDVATKLGAQDYVAELGAFYGTCQSSYNLILVPLYGHVGFGPLVDTLAGERHIYNILGPQRLAEGIPVFGDTDYFKQMQRHEFSHSFVNPLTDTHWDQVSEYAHLYDALPVQQVCGEWQECVNEHIIRAVTTFMAFQDSDAAGQAALEIERGRSVVWIDDVLVLLREYAQNRDRYPTMDAFYPRLLAVFTRAAATPQSSAGSNPR